MLHARAVASWLCWPSALMASPSPSEAKRVSRFAEMRMKKERIVHYLNTGSYSTGLSESQKRAVRAQAKFHTYDESRDELYYISPKSDVRRVVTDEDEILGILRFHHSDAGAHSGINSTLSKVSTSYTWSGMKQDVVDFVKSCDRCQQNDKTKTHAPELRTIKTTEPLQLVGMNVNGPLPTTQEGYKYVLTFTDYYTKFVELFPLKNKYATGVSSCIQTFVYRWGAPKKLLSDQGREFVAKVNEDLRKRFGITRSITSAYHPQTKGLVERTNRTLRVRLSKLVNDNQDDWVDYLDAMAFSLRTQKQASTEYTPFFLMFGRHPRTVLEMDQADDVTLSLNDTNDSEDIDVAVTKRKQTIAAVHCKVMENVAVSQEKQKIAFKRR